MCSKDATGLTPILCWTAGQRGSACDEGGPPGRVGVDLAPAGIRERAAFWSGAETLTLSLPPKTG